ncbi:MAG: ureidoglycolate lyase [Alphaproteobacteria bacterium]|nr:ureidoglycolate lyase [Alphaproteobacteria bacterium]
MAGNILPVEPLTRAAFEPFGDVIEADGAERFKINNGSTTRFHDLARVDVAAGGGHTLVNIFRARPLPMPLTVAMVEKHPLGSQAFIPLEAAPFLVVVAPPGDAVSPTDLRAFLAAAGQGVSYAPGVWHHPVIALGRQTDFLVIDRGGPGDNLAEFFFAEGERRTVEISRPAEATAP